MTTIYVIYRFLFSKNNFVIFSYSALLEASFPGGTETKRFIIESAIKHADLLIIYHPLIYVTVLIITKVAIVFCPR